MACRLEQSMRLKKEREKKTRTSFKFDYMVKTLEFFLLSCGNVHIKLSQMNASLCAVFKNQVFIFIDKFTSIQLYRG